MDIHNKVVVVTGASSGIGLATARSFARAGAKVVLAARSIETLNAVAESLRWEGHEALAIATDVRDQDTATEAAQHMQGDPSVPMSIAGAMLDSTYLVPKTAEYVADRIVEAARTEPADLFLDEGIYAEAAY